MKTMNLRKFLLPFFALVLFSLLPLGALSEEIEEIVDSRSDYDESSDTGGQTTITIRIINPDPGFTYNYHPDNYTDKTDDKSAYQKTNPTLSGEGHRANIELRTKREGVVSKESRTFTVRIINDAEANTEACLKSGRCSPDKSFQIEHELTGNANVYTDEVSKPGYDKTLIQAKQSSSIKIDTQGLEQQRHRISRDGSINADIRLAPDDRRSVAEVNTRNWVTREETIRGPMHYSEQDELRSNIEAKTWPSYESRYYRIHIQNQYDNSRRNGGNEK